MLIIAGSMTLADAGQVEPMMAAATEMMRASRTEPGCIEYVFSIDPLAAGTIRIFEIWESEEALAGHFASPHMAEYRERVKDVPLIGRTLKKYTVGAVTDL